jgi:hypothetical protein
MLKARLEYRLLKLCVVNSNYKTVCMLSGETGGRVDQFCSLGGGSISPTPS